MPPSAPLIKVLVPRLSVQFPSKRGRWGRRRQGTPVYGSEAVMHVPGLDCFGLDPFWTFRLPNPSTLLVMVRYMELTALQPTQLKVGVYSPYVLPIRFILDEDRAVATVRIRLHREEISLDECRGQITCYVEEVDQAHI